MDKYSYGRAKMCKKRPKDTARYYEMNPKLRLLERLPAGERAGERAAVDEVERAPDRQAECEP